MRPIPNIFQLTRLYYQRMPKRRPLQIRSRVLKRSTGNKVVCRLRIGYSVGCCLHSNQRSDQQFSRIHVEQTVLVGRGRADSPPCKLLRPESDTREVDRRFRLELDPGGELMLNIGTRVQSRRVITSMRDSNSLRSGHGRKVACQPNVNDVVPVVHTRSVCL